jgi:hypothetical protein
MSIVLSQMKGLSVHVPPAVHVPMGVSLKEPLGHGAVVLVPQATPPASPSVAEPLSVPEPLSIVVVPLSVALPLSAAVVESVTWESVLAAESEPESDSNVSALPNPLSDRMS